MAQTAGLVLPRDMLYQINGQLDASGSSSRKETSYGYEKRTNLSSRNKSNSVHMVVSGKYHYESFHPLSKDIFLDVDPQRHNYGRRATLCENLLGIVPGQFGGKFGETNGKKMDRRIMVHALTPGGEAVKDGRIKIGKLIIFFIVCTDEKLYKY